MANTKISQLPSWTGTAADLRWFVMNNSGETETFKFSGYSTSITYGAGTDSIKSTNATLSSGTDSIAIGNGASVPSGIDNLAIGHNASNTSGNRSTIVGSTATAGDAGSAFGWGSTASGLAAAAFGYSNTASSQYSLSLGNSNYVGANFGIGIGGNNYMVGGTYNIALGWDIALSSGSYNITLGGKTNTNTGGDYGSIVGGQSNQIQGGTHNFIGGGNNNILNSNTRNNYAIVGGADNTANSETGYGLMTGQYNTNQGRWGFVAGRSNTIGTNNAQFCLGWGNTMTGDNSDTLGIFASYNNTLDVSSTQAATIIGSSNSQLRTRGTYSQHNGSTIFGSNASYIKESSSNNNKYSGSRTGIILSNESGIYNSNSANYLDHNLILSSSASTIYDSSISQIIGGLGNTISGKTNVVMLGTSGRTADASNTTYVENLQVLRQAKYGNYNNGSRATNYTIDWNNGNIQKVVLTGSCVFSATNITDGTTYIFKVSQDNSGNRAATWSSGIFKFANSTPPTLSTGANAVDIFTFVAMDGLLYGVAQLNFG